MFDYGNANDNQKQAISTTEGPLLIIAGPGTGKTYTLVKRVVYLITECNVMPEEIMIATFTEKAAKELVTRISNELLSIGISININEMYIGTFHSICLRILKEHLEYTRIKKNYRMLDNFDQQYMVFQKINEFRKVEHLKQIGIYVDEAHHMFGADLEKALHKGGTATSLRATINELAKELESQGNRI